MPDKMFKKLFSISVFNSPHSSLGLGSLTTHPLPLKVKQNGTARALAARQESVPGAREPSREGGEKEGGGREEKVSGDWLIPVAGARSLRLLSAFAPEKERETAARSKRANREPAGAGR